MEIQYRPHIVDTDVIAGAVFVGAVSETSKYGGGGCPSTVLLLTVGIAWTCYRGYLGPSCPKLEKESENEFPGTEKSKTESKKSPNRLFFNYFDSFSAPFSAFWAPRPRGPENSYSDTPSCKNGRGRAWGRPLVKGCESFSGTESAILNRESGDSESCDSNRAIPRSLRLGGDSESIFCDSTLLRFDSFLRFSLRNFWRFRARDSGNRAIRLKTPSSLK